MDKNWLDSPTCEGWWLWNGDQSEGEILYVVGSEGEFEIADDDILEYEWDKKIMTGVFEDYNNYWEMTSCDQMDHGKWKLIKKAK